MAGNRVNLRDLFKAKKEEMRVRLFGDRAVISHPAEKGQATEEQWRGLLRAYLPSRYHVDKGFIIDADGNMSDQSDVVVFDRQYSPILFQSGGVLYIPAESVYAVFEVKQDLSKGHLEYTGRKLASVRSLRRTSAPIAYAAGQYPPKPPSRIIGGLLATEASWSPPFGPSFVTALGKLPAEGQIDLGCALVDGAFVVAYDDQRTVLNLETSLRDLSIVVFVFNLLAALQGIGTVSAIEYNEYLKRVK